MRASLIFPYTNKKKVTFNVKYEIVLYTPVFNARWGVPDVEKMPTFSRYFLLLTSQSLQVATVGKWIRQRKWCVHLLDCSDPLTPAHP